MSPRATQADRHGQDRRAGNSLCSQRIEIEKQPMNRYFPDFEFRHRQGSVHVEGWVRASPDGEPYKLRLELPPDYPWSEPRTYIIHPKVLWDCGRRRTLNSLGSSHSFHTESSGLRGHVQLSLHRAWDATGNCVHEITRAHLWLAAYEHHLRTGQTIDSVLP